MLRIVVGLLALGLGIVLIARRGHEPSERATPPRPDSMPLPVRPPPSPSPEQIATRMQSPDPEQRWKATLEMIEAGPDAIPALLAVLDTKQDQPPFASEGWPGRSWCRRADVFYAVLEIGRPAIGPLAQALDGPSRLHAIKLLGFLGTRYDEVLPHLIPCLDPDGHEDTYTAAFAISRMKERAAPALPELARLFENEDIAWAAADSIVDIGPAALPYIERELQRSYSGRLMGDLMYLEADCGPLVPTLIEILQRGESHQKRDAAWAITEIGPAAAAAKEVLREYALNPKDLGWATSISGNYCAVGALLAIGVPDDEAELLINSILERGEVPNLRMCERVSRMDPRRAERIRPRIVESLRANSYACAERLEALGDPSPEPAPLPPDMRTLDELIDIPPAEGSYWRGISWGIPRRYRTLVARAPLPPRAVEALRGQLTARDAADRVGAALALRVCDLDPGEYLQALVEGVRLENYRGLGMSRRRYRDTQLRVAAIEALAELGERGKPGIPALYKVLEDRYEPVRKAARDALARLE